MPGTTRYSATFDRPYEEDDRRGPEVPPARRSRSMSLQAPGAFYSPLGNGHPHRSSSIDNGTAEDPIPARTSGKAVVKAHTNPFQFVKVGTCPLYKKAEEQLKKNKVKQPEVLKEEEEEWQSNLDSWKSRRRKMSEDVFKRQEEIRQIEVEEQTTQTTQKKIKTFSEMVESRAHRGRALSMCLLTSPLEFQDWDPDNITRKKMSSVDNLFSGGSEENSNVNSEDEAGIFQKLGNGSHSRMNGNSHENGKSESSNGNREDSIVQKNDQGQCSLYIDSGLESISSSHRAGDIADSGSDFSQDSGSIMDCDSPRSTLLSPRETIEELSPQGKLAGEVQNGLSNGVNGSVLKNGDVKHLSNGGAVAKGKAEGVTSEKERSIESENEMYVDDFEELKRNKASSETNKECPSPEALPPLTSKLSQKPSPKTPNAVPSVNDEQKNEKNVAPKPQTSEKPNLVRKKKKSSTAKLQNGNQKANVDSKIQATTNDTTLNIIFQSNKDTDSKTIKSPSSPSNPKPDIVKPNPPPKPDILPVEKIAEEMEKLILEQLEEEEREKEMEAEVRLKQNTDDATPPKQLEPPKEKPPPPPEAVNNTQKASAVKRVNSTKRIKKEIHKRRSNFLGIENDENGECEETNVPPPPGLEDMLKVEMQIDRDGRKQLKSEADKRLSFEESELLKKEREIIENLESEERRKLLMGLTGEDAKKSNHQESNTVLENGHLKVENKCSEEEMMRLAEERQLREREDYIRKQEDDKTALKLSTPLVSVGSPSVPTLPITSSLHSEKVANALLDNGDGKNTYTSGNKGDVVKEKPIPPAKPLKKKEAIRKERERLRQEQEVLQREREEHRQKLLLEQEELKKSSPNSHAPDVPASRIGPIPPAKPVFPPQLTHPSNARENGAYSSRNHHGAQNGIAGSPNSESKHLPPSLPVNRQNKAAAPRSKTVQKEAWGQQKVPSVKKQNDSLTESRYNQNHWLIQEAEIRRIAELKDRQAQAQLENRLASEPHPQTHLVKDEVCSNPKASQRLPTKVQQGSPSNYAGVTQVVSPADQHWNYRPPVHASNGQMMKYPPPASVEKLQTHISYTRNMIDPPTKPSRVVPLERQEQMLSVSGRKKCSHCSEELGRGAAMIIESLQLYYHIQCFQCCVCHAQLGNGSCGTDVRVRNNKLHCQNCYSNDEAGLKFSQV